MAHLVEQLHFRDPGDWVAVGRAIDLLESAGFSVGRSQAHAPRGILYGLYDIQKWRNLSAADRAALHGVMSGDGRCGPITVEIFQSCPPEGLAALRLLIDSGECA